MQAHFGRLTRQQYQARQDTAFLQGFTTTQPETTLRHISALALDNLPLRCGAATSAVNPWADVIFPADVIGGPRVPKYSWAEADELKKRLKVWATTWHKIFAGTHGTPRHTGLSNLQRGREAKLDVRG